VSYFKQKISFREKKFSLLIYKKSLRTLLSFVRLIWGKCAFTHLKKLQIFQNKTLRTITNSPWFVRNRNIHKDFNIPYPQDHIKKSDQWLLLVYSEVNRIYALSSQHRTTDPTPSSTWTSSPLTCLNKHLVLSHRNNIVATP
jgi:hypothetical protein